jgi:predicted transglutaminase-like cysteine proteinase
MIRKLIISAAVLAALIHGKEANAAGPGGFARDLASTFIAHEHVAGAAPVARHGDDFSVTQRNEIIGISAAVTEAIGQVDAYMDLFAGQEAKAAAPQGCYDCADIKRDQLIGKGWSAGAMRIAYAVSSEGRIERVLVVETALGELIVGDGKPAFATGSSGRRLAISRKSLSYYDI